MPLPVRVVGTLPGVLFVLYVLLGAIELVARRFDLRTTALAPLASLLPFGPFLFAHRVPSF